MTVLIVNNELEEREQRIERMMRHAWYETALEYKEIRDRDLYKDNGTGKRGWLTWADYCQERWSRTDRSIDTQIQRATETDQIRKIFRISPDQLPASMSHATELSKLETPEQRAEVWNRVLSLGAPITAKVVQAEVQRFRAELEKDWYMLDEWNTLPVDEIDRILSSQYGDKKFNQTNENIEWAAWSWNPITGCLHGCDYCYARDIAERFYPQNFDPSFYPNRLQAPGNMQVPAPRWPGDIGYRGVFVCSMSDLFGKWNPEIWIESVLNAIELNPQWIFLLLTKFPIRMAEFTYPSNVWLGTSVDKQWAIERAEKGFQKIKDSGFDGVCWLSCEPMLERLTFSKLELFDWLVMGGASKSTQTAEVHPPFDDIVYLYNQARSSQLMIYQKTNLIPGMPDDQRIREYPEAMIDG